MLLYDVGPTLATVGRIANASALALRLSVVDFLASFFQQASACCVQPCCAKDQHGSEDLCDLQSSLLVNDQGLAISPTTLNSSYFLHPQ